MAARRHSQFDPRDLTALDPPFFVRKLTTGGHWPAGTEATPADRIARGVNDVFKNDGGRVSIYRVEGAFDLERVAIGINSTRTLGSICHDMLLLRIYPSELEQAGLSIEQSPGNTYCHHANMLHFDIHYDATAIRDLVAHLVESVRDRMKINKQMMKRAVDTATPMGCRGIDNDSPSCECEAA